MKKANRTSVPSKLVLRREAVVVLGVTELSQVAGASQFQGCSSTVMTKGPGQ